MKYLNDWSLSGSLSRLPNLEARSHLRLHSQMAFTAKDASLRTTLKADDNGQTEFAGLHFEGGSGRASFESSWE